MLKNDFAKTGEESKGDFGDVCPNVVVKNNDSRWEKPWAFAFYSLSKVVRSINLTLFSHCSSLLPFNAQISAVNHALMIPKMQKSVHIRLGTQDKGSSMLTDAYSTNNILPQVWWRQCHQDARKKILAMIFDTFPIF